MEAQFVANESLRADLRFDIYNEPILAAEQERPINEAFLEGSLEIYDSIPYTFKELPYDAIYMNLLKEKYTFETGKEFTSSDPEEIQHLIDEDFADMNFIMNNVSIGMGSELLQNMLLKSDEEKANFLSRWNTFHRTPNTDSSGVDDSRSFLEIKFPGKIDPDDEAAVQRAKDLGWGGFEVTGQFGDFIKGSGTDPLAWLTFASGAGFATNKLIQSGVSKLLAPKVALSMAGGTFSGIHNTGKQMVEMTAGGNQEWDPSVVDEDTGEIVGGYVDQSFDVKETLASMGYGFALTPALTYAAGATLGPISRVITSPKQTFNKVIGFAAGDKSEMAAAQGVMLNMQDKLAPLNAEQGLNKVVTDLRDFIGTGYNAVDNYFNVAFESIKSAPIKRQSIDGLVERWNSQMGGAQGHQLSKTWNLMYDKYLLGENAKGNPNLNVKEVPLIDLARQLRKEFYSANLKDKKDNAGINRDTIGDFTSTINRVMTKAVKKVDPKKAAELDKSYRLFKTQTTNNKYGEDLLAMAADTSTESITRFLNKMLNPDFSWAEFSGAIKHFEKLDYIVGSKGNNKLATGLRTKIEKAMGTKIMEAKDGAKLLTELTSTVDGRKTLKQIFPSLTKELDDIIFMQKNLGNWGGADSVIGNMTMANLGAMTGKSILGEQGKLMGPLASIVGWNKLMNSNYFKNAMVHAYKNKGGTLDSATRRYIVKNFTKEDGSAMTMANVNAIQDTMWGYMYAGYALRGEDVLAERTSDRAQDAYGDLKVQFEGLLNPIQEMQIQ
jgi:hypothetical protein